MAQKTIYKDPINNWRIVEETEPNAATVLWIADDLEETELSFSIEDLSKLLPVINAWYEARKR